MNQNELVTTIVKTIRVLIDQGYINPSEYERLGKNAEHLTYCDLKEELCCPLCHEVACDGGCPLEDLRKSFGYQ